MTEATGLQAAYLIDATGRGKKISWPELLGWQPEQGLLWVHLDYTAPRVRQWLEEESGLEAVVADRLLTEETRPRVTKTDGGLLAALRGVNLNPNADPEDMVSVRLWLDEHRIISTGRRRLNALEEIQASLEAGRGPGSSAEFLVDIADRLTERMGPVIDEVEEQVAVMEEDILEKESYSLRMPLSAVRRQTIALRRYIAPQREALARLLTEQVSWLGADDKMRLREIADHVTRYVEDLDSVRDRAAVAHEELASRLSEQMESRMYVLSIVAAIFLPLGFLTGLLGINVGGIPGANAPQAFLVFCLLLVGVAAGLLVLFKKKNWM